MHVVITPPSNCPLRQPHVSQYAGPQPLQCPLQLDRSAPFPPPNHSPHPPPPPPSLTCPLLCLAVDPVLLYWQLVPCRVVECQHSQCATAATGHQLPAVQWVNSQLREQLRTRAQLTLGQQDATWGEEPGRWGGGGSSGKGRGRQSTAG